MKAKAVLIIMSALVAFAHTALAGELISDSQKIVPFFDGQTPQAPRVSPDGAKVVFEAYVKQSVNLWIADSDGLNRKCLTCTMKMKLENGYFHPSGKYLIFNVVPVGNLKTGGIYTAELTNEGLANITQIAKGARPQFSKPKGHVILYETGLDNKNVLAYQIIGPNPLKPEESTILELRGPIQEITWTAEISHPTLAPDGTTIVFAARNEGIRGNALSINDADRQQVYALWEKLLNVPKSKINDELKTFFGHIRGPDSKVFLEEDVDFVPAINNRNEVTNIDFDRFEDNKNGFFDKPTIVPGYKKKHMFLVWILGFLDILDSKYATEVQTVIYPRLWMTDVFGAPIVPLVADLKSTALPQKWPTISSDGSFAVFEAGHYKNRHIYLVKKTGGKWRASAVKLTSEGSYNSSPEVDPTGQWLYFESNRDGTKSLWRARLDWDAINKALGQ